MLFVNIGKVIAVIESTAHSNLGNTFLGAAFEDRFRFFQTEYIQIFVETKAGFFFKDPGKMFRTNGAVLCGFRKGDPGSIVASDVFQGTFHKGTAGRQMGHVTVFCHGEEQFHDITADHVPTEFIRLLHRLLQTPIQCFYFVSGIR